MRGPSVCLLRVRTLVVLIIFFTVVDLPALLVLGIWFLGQLLSAQKATNLGMDGGVAWWAHVGGFIAGLVAMLILAPSDESSRRAARTRRTGDQNDDFYF